MQSLDKEVVITGYNYKLGLATFCLEYPPTTDRNRVLDINFEVGTSKILDGRAAPFFGMLPGEIRPFYQNNSILELFDTISMSNAEVMRSEIDGQGLPAHGLRMVIVTPETFNRIHQVPSWVGSYVWWNGTVICNVEYIRDILSGKGNFGGATYTIDQFIEDNLHELLHGYEDAEFFNNDEELARHFFRNSLWYMEGLKEALARQNTAISLSDLAGRIREIKKKYPDFSIDNLTSDFFQFDQSPTPRNGAYQFCKLVSRKLAPIVNKRLAGREKRPEEFYQPYEGLYWVINKAVNRYRDGNRETISDVLNEELGIDRGVLREIEKEIWDDLEKAEK